MDLNEKIKNLTQNSGVYIMKDIGGNIIYIDRKNQIVAAITGHFKPLVFDRVEFIEKNIVAALI